MTDTHPALGGICYGVKAIAAHLGLPPRKAQALIDKKRLPVFREDRTVCAARAGLDRWVAERDAYAEATRRAGQADALAATA